MVRRLILSGILLVVALGIGRDASALPQNSVETYYYSGSNCYPEAIVGWDTLDCYGVRDSGGTTTANFKEVITTNCLTGQATYAWYEWCGRWNYAGSTAPDRCMC